jgi:hypothetical protein
MKTSEALPAYRVLARSEGRSERTVGWIASAVGYFSQFLGLDIEPRGHPHRNGMA